MLPLDSPRWSELDCFYGEPEQVPLVLGEWVDAVGFDQAMTIYHRDLYDLFLHQGTITNVAYAVVPWIVAHCPRAGVADRVGYVCDVGLVEWRRLTCGVHHIRDGGDPEPEWLMSDYKGAVEAARELAEDLLDQPLNRDLRKSLCKVMPALFGNGEMVP